MTEYEVWGHVPLRMTGREQLDWWSQRPIPPRQYVYAIQGAALAPVKIGTSRNPLKRLQQLQTGTPDDLNLLHVIPGDQQTERELHVWFAEWQHRDEWFCGDNIDLMLEMLDALAHHQIRDEAANPSGWPRLGTFLPVIASLRSTAQVAAARAEMVEWLNNGFGAPEIATQIGWDYHEVDREITIMIRMPHMHGIIPRYQRTCSGSAFRPLRAHTASRRHTPT